VQRGEAERKDEDMKIGLFGINFGLCGDVDAMVRVARHAEDSELESLWTGEHVVLPDPQAPPSPPRRARRSSIRRSRSGTSLRSRRA
jgi:alkanesulfonate monooxygenase SsuD/methylene tetrahydromethanopterin reductase-like flavin-dependent oxidoreductase (luciferase family)